MSGIKERYPNSVCTNARFTFWSYLSSDLYEDLLMDFVQRKHEVRIDSLTARRMLTSTIKTKALRIKRNDKMPLQAQHVLLSSGNGVWCLDFTAHASLIHENLECTFDSQELDANMTTPINRLIFLLSLKFTCYWLFFQLFLREEQKYGRGFHNRIFNMPRNFAALIILNLYRY